MSSVDATQQRKNRMISSDQALKIAQADAEAAYGDLSDYRISMMLEPDGWHVDYELTQLGEAGGGPHYVLDAMTGSVLSKRYEQ